MQWFRSTPDAFTAAQAAQKSLQLMCLATVPFTAAQAAQKCDVVCDSIIARFTAAQAAQKKGGRFR